MTKKHFICILIPSSISEDIEAMEQAKLALVEVFNAEANGSDREHLYEPVAPSPAALAAELAAEYG